MALIPIDGMIETAYPELTRLEEVYVRFECTVCEIINSSNEFADASDNRFHVCANCFEKFEKQ